MVVYPEADAGAPYLAEANEAVELPGWRAEDTYLNTEALIEVIRRSRADAVHPGYGFLAENAEFAEAVIAAGAAFVGPAPEWLRVMGDKIKARELLAKHGYPLFPASEVLADIGVARHVAQAMGYPLMLKPVAGGGGIGMRVVRDDTELEKAFYQATQLAKRAFGDASVYLERYIDEPRHIEFQLLADGHGNAMHVYERECSIQRRHQKVIEESPAPGLDRIELETMAERAAEVVGGLGYDNVGTLETLRDRDGKFGFLELNARIQVEHAVTEAVTGLDLVAAQIELAAGGPLPPRPPLNGHALEARVYAEDPRSQLPDTGVLRTFRLPEMFGVRVETGYQAGQTVTPYYDPLLAKVIGWGNTREQAVGRTLVGLKGLDVVGVKTNIPLLLQVLESETFLAGRVHTGFLSTMEDRQHGAS